MRRRFMSNKKSFDYSQYMTVEALEDGVTVIMPRNVEYNMGNGWVALEKGVASPTLAKGQLISFKSQLSSGAFGTISISGYCFLRGNCMSLLGKATLHYSAFHLLFDSCPIVGIEETFLPVTTLADRCYDGMFYGCTSLTTAPELPATTLAEDCYCTMFSDCTSLTTAPELPATTLVSGCYGYMFSDCTSLTTAPALPVTTLADRCYDGMFYGCTSLTTAPELPATTLVSGCYGYMFYGCTSLTTAPELPATTLAEGCYSTMFSYCTSLTTAPELPATTLAEGCYSAMFKGCTKLNYIKMMATDISASRCLEYWVSNVASTGTFIKNKNATWNVTGEDGIPVGWTIQYADPND